MPCHKANQVNFFACLIFVFILGFGTSALANPKEGSSGKMDAQVDAMMQKWQAYAAPNEHHKELETLVGHWDHVVKWWMMPSSEPEVSKGTTETRWIMGGRFLLSEVQGMSMGQPFEGMGLIGYDNAQKQYQTIWIDNMGTGMMQGKGTLDSGQGIMKDTGTFSDPFMGKRTYRAETKYIDDDHFTYEFFTPDQTGKEYRMMAITYSRKK